ncbi:hypothetical protein GSI_12640 [Ganoderma sinense ZZ0214-1]|uniref:Nitrogen regulatory protein areA GATA-like domain-containing protein n=1 Tax=Ganoderma sinense ZZ0214-1 TaxID=1077348 RepID=A0A2G8RTE5_9APHY|nr:hypothetical protein GSI_12640 [Ganoderma sinense ZZ0214-1]
MAMPVPPTLTSYLPVLLVSVTHNAVPDDSSFDTQPQAQVDYLSHDWKEEDVWRSWRSMTRQKNAIANGMRLENASWRTWWKQRNNLPTVSPETLNWLKDSDVTWLYGPLHIGNDWTDYSQRKTPKLHAGQRKTSTDALPGPYKTNVPSMPPSVPKKPILKRRSISQLLSLPPSPFFNQIDSDEEEEDMHIPSSAPPVRPPLVHTKSDTHISMRGRPFRKNSPPRIIAQDGAASQVGPTPPVAQVATLSDGSGSTSSDQDLSGGSSVDASGPAKKKHISFNTFVEQCIAIEKPKVKRSATGPTVGARFYDAYDDGSDSELGYDGEYDEPSSMYYFNDNVAIGSDSEDDDDDVLEMRTPSSRSRSNSASSMRKPPITTPLRAGTTSSRPRPPTVRRHSTDREHVTIAPIAPTLLKSTGVGNELMSLPEGKALESPKDVDLVYVPTTNHYGMSGNGANDGDVYHHRESYFSVGTASSYPRSPLPRSPAPGSSPQIPDATMPPEQQPPASLVRRSGSGTIFPAQSMVDSPMQLDDTPLEDAYDYFGGPDLGEDFSHSRAHAHRRRQRRDVRDDEVITRYAEGGAASVTNGRSRAWGTSPSPSPVESPRTPDAEMPVVVVNEVNGAVEERAERSRESSPLATPLPYRIYEQRPHADSPLVSSTAAVPVSIPRATPSHPHAHLVASSIPNYNPPLSSSTPTSGLCADPDLLSPSDVVRGRQPHSPSVSGSTTTASSSYHSSDSRSASSSRGRSSTRTSSFSDRERSGSRSRSCSRGTSSPIGSISPTGSAIGIVNGSSYAGVRSRDGRDRRRRGNGAEDERERGRDRTGRRLGDSLSPPGQSSGSSSNSPVLAEASLEKQPMISRVPSPPSSVSGSSTETASVSTVGPSAVQQHYQQSQAPESAERPKLSIHAPSAKPPAVPLPNVPSPIPEVEEEELRRSRHPTPANSPVAAFRIAVPPAQMAQPVSSPISASHGHTSGSVPRPSPKSVSTADAGDVNESPLRSPTSPTASSSSRHPSRAQRVSFDGMQEQAGTLVNRAAEIVQSARGFLGSIWSSNAASA